MLPEITRNFSPVFYIVVLFFPFAAACGNGTPASDSESSYECNLGSQSNGLIHSPGGLLISAEFESIDVNFSSPIVLTIFAQNPSHSLIRESITIKLNGMHLPNPLVATLVAHKPVAEYQIDLDVPPGETTCQRVTVEFETYETIGTGNYNLYYVEGEEHLDHMNLSGALEIIIIAPETIAKDQDLPYQVKVHNPTSTTIQDISVRELHRQFEEFIPALLPGDTVTFTHTLSSSEYQNTNMTGVTVMTETSESGSDLASKTIEVEGFFEE